MDVSLMLTTIKSKIAVNIEQDNYQPQKLHTTDLWCFVSLNGVNLKYQNFIKTIASNKKY